MQHSFHWLVSSNSHTSSQARTQNTHALGWEGRGEVRSGLVRAKSICRLPGTTPLSNSLLRGGHQGDSTRIIGRKGYINTHDNTWLKVNKNMTKARLARPGRCLNPDDNRPDPGEV